MKTYREVLEKVFEKGENLKPYWLSHNKQYEKEYKKALDQAESEIEEIVDKKKKIIISNMQAILDIYNFEKIPINYEVVYKVMKEYILELNKPT